MAENSTRTSNATRAGAVIVIATMRISELGDISF